MILMQSERGFSTFNTKSDPYLYPKHSPYRSPSKNTKIVNKKVYLGGWPIVKSSP